MCVSLSPSVGIVQLLKTESSKKIGQLALDFALHWLSPDFGRKQKPYQWFKFCNVILPKINI